MSPLSMAASRALVYAHEMHAPIIPEDVLDPDEQEVAWEELVGLKLIIDDRTLAGRGGFNLTARGRSTARRQSQRVRRESAQCAILQGLAAGSRSTDSLQAEPLYGEPFSDEELQDAVRALQDRKCIEGKGGWQSDGHLLFASITPLGRQALDSELGPEAFAHHGGGHVSVDARQYTQQGNGNLQQNGNGNTATINNAGGAGLEAVAAFLEQIRGAERIDHSADAALDSQLELADDAVETNDSKKLRTALQTLPFLVTTAFGEDLGHAMAEQAGNLLASLPI